MSVSTTSSNASNLYLYYVKKLLTVLQPRLALYQLGKKAPLPQGYGKQVKWLLYTKIASSTSALTEGTTPSEISFTTSNITATIAQYGQFAKVSDLLDMTAIDPVLESLAELFGRAGAESIEDLIVAELDANLTAAWANKRGSANAVLASDVVTMKDFLRQQINLKVSYVGPHEQMGKYVCVLHPSNEYDILSETNVGGWLDVNSYQQTDKQQIIRGEIGTCYNMRFMTSDKMTAAANSGSVSVKNNYVIGEECFGVVELGKKGVELIIKPSDSGGQANPLNLYGTVGYKIMGFVAKNFAAARGVVLAGASSL